MIRLLLGGVRSGKSALAETLLLAGPWPGPLGAAGMALAVTGLVLYVCRQV